jgi:RNA polymerase sigma-70 factor (ECF subfamily)
MRWRVRSIRRAASFPSHEGAELRPLPGLGDPLLAGSGLAGVGLGSSGLGASGLSAAVFAPLAAMTGGSRSGLPAKLSADEDSNPEIDFSAQPSGPDGVQEDMATLVLDRPPLGAAPASLPGGGQVLSGSQEPASDAAIMKRAAAGDESAFNYLAEKYHRPIHHFLYRMVRNQAIAEELAQEVFLRVYRSRESYRAEAKFTTWLYRIATNLAVNHARDTKHERAVQNVYLDAPDEQTGTRPDVACDEPSAEQRLLREERMKAIRAQVMVLPERQRMAVVLHKYQGMDYREIGQVLKLSESAVKSLLFRAYQTLRETLKEFV